MFFFYIGVIILVTKGIMAVFSGRAKQMGRPISRRKLSPCEQISKNSFVMLLYFSEKKLVFFDRMDHFCFAFSSTFRHRGRTRGGIGGGGVFVCVCVCVGRTLRYLISVPLLFKLL